VRRKRETDEEEKARRDAEYRELLEEAKKRDPRVLAQHRRGLPGFKRKRKQRLNTTDDRPLDGHSGKLGPPR